MIRISVERNRKRKAQTRQVVKREVSRISIVKIKIKH